MAADETLEIREGIARVQDELAPGQLTDEQLLVLAEADDRRGRATSLSTRDHLGAATLQHRNHGVGCSQVDSNDPCQLRSCALGPSTLSPKANGNRAEG